MPRDDVDAVRWYRLAADQGSAEAYVRLGFMHADGEGVAADPGEAVRCWRRAADLGSADAQFMLGAKYLEGEGVPENPVFAHMWLTVARANGHDRAAEGLGLVETLMTPEQIRRATELASAYLGR